MDALTRDDLVHTIDQTLGFYGKKLDKVATTFWLSALAQYDPDDIKNAFLEYTKHGKYSPKPVDIIEMIQELRAVTRSKLPPPDQSYTPCPEHIRKAWSWFIKFYSGYDFGAEDSTTPEQQDQYLRTVNEQAKLYNQPEAIPDEYKLK